MKALRLYCKLVKWDWIGEFKRLDTIITMLLFSVITLMIFSFALDATVLATDSGDELASLRTKLTAGLLWITFMLSGSIGIERAFRTGGDDRVLMGVLLAPVSRSVFYYARVTSTFAFVFIMECLTLVVFILLYNLDLEWNQLLRILGLMFGGTLGYIALGVTLSAMTRVLQGGEVILRILLFPLMIPILAAVVEGTQDSLNGLALSVQQLTVITTFSVMYLAAGQILFQTIMADFDAT